MHDLSVRASDAEQMDEPGCNERVLLRTIDQFQTINMLFARYRFAIKKWMVADMLREPGRSYRVLDIGAGGCDIPVWLLRYGGRKNLDLGVTAIDADPRTVRHAQDVHGAIKGLEILCRDAFDAADLGPFDYVFSNHVMHHLDEDAAVRLLDLAGDLATRCWVLSDLRRSRLAYTGFGLLGRAWKRGSFAYEDGLLSIRKSFTADEARSLAARSRHARRIRVETSFPGRLLWAGTTNTTLG